MAEHIYTCKIGADIPDEAWEPDGQYIAHDAPMRVAIEQQFERQFGIEASFMFSGWGAELAEIERSVVENRKPDPSAMIDEWIETAREALVNVQKSRVWFEPYSGCLNRIVAAIEALDELAALDVARSF